MASIRLSGVTRRYGATAVVDAVSLEVANGEFLALLGPSGCGKTTLLRAIAGFERLDGGEVAFDERIVSGASVHVPPEARHVGIVFQSYALWPHMSVAANVGYPLRVAGVGGDTYRHRVEAALETVGLAGLGERRPAALSGGQRQRVALARCLVMEPSLVLLDEPMANLDVHLRASMEEEFLAFHRKTGATMIYVTHDQAEAMALAHRIAVMDHGRIVQVADPRTLYREPATTMVAGFIGQGTIVDAALTGANGAARCAADLLGATVEVRCAPGRAAGPARVSLRPEDLALDDSGIEGHVRRVIYRGGASTVEVAPAAHPETSLVLRATEPPGEGARVRVAVRDGWVIPGA